MGAEKNLTSFDIGREKHQEPRSRQKGTQEHQNYETD